MLSDVIDAATIEDLKMVLLNFRIKLKRNFL